MSKEPEVCGFKSKKAVPFIERLFGLEKVLLDIIMNNNSFHKRKVYFQRHLDNVVKDINKSERCKVR